MIAPKLEPPTARQEAEAYELLELRDGGLCQRCRRGGEVQFDHRMNRSQGGWTVIENLQALCGPSAPDGGCHLFKTENPEKASAAGWSVPGWAHWSWYPARRWLRTPVNTHRLAWVLYVADTWVEIDEQEAFTRRAGLLRTVPELVS